MDLDISDILAEVSKPTAQSNQYNNSATPTTYDSTSSYTDHQLLVRAWTSERCSPSLLPYPTSLIERTMSRIQNQILKIEDLTSGVDYSNNSSGGAGAMAARGSTRGDTKPSNNTNLILSIIQTDLSRTQFIVRSYLRQRLDKITKDAGWFLKYHVDNVDDDDDHGSDSYSLLSKSELQFLKHHQSLLSEFYDSSFLAAFPENLRRLDDSAGGVNMVEAPDGGTGVVVRCLKEEWGNGEDVEDGVGAVGVGGEEGPDVELRFRRGEVWVVRWRDVRKGVVEGDLECL